MARDTTTEARAAQYEAYRRLGGARRVELAARMSEDAREVTKAGIAARHPELSERERHERLLCTLLGESLHMKISMRSDERG